MTQFKTDNYKNFIIQYFITEAGKFYASIPGLNISVRSPHNTYDGSFDTFESVKKEAEAQVDSWLCSSIKNVAELAISINDALTMHGYDTSEIETEVLTNILKQCDPNFITVKNLT